MRYAMIAALLLSGCASKMETAWQTTHAIDGLQTLSIARDDCYHEQNVIASNVIGRHPSEGEVVAFFAGTALLHAWVGRELERWPRWQKAWQAVTIVRSTSAVVHNHRIGVRIDGSNTGCQGY